MAFPDGVQTVTVTAGAAGYRTLDGDPYQGAIRFTPSVSRVVSAEHGVIALGSVNATLGASGQFTENPALLAVDANGFSPPFTYRVDEEFTNAPGRSYNISLPAAVPTVALPSLVEVAASDGTTVSAPAVLSVNGDSGAVVIDAADIGADPAGTATAAVAIHDADTSNVHGIADTTALETTAGAAAKVSAHAAVVTSVHGIPDTALLETQSGAASKVTTHAGATDPHGDRAYADSTKLDKTGGTISGALVIDRFGAPVFPVGQTGAVASVSIPSSYTGGDDDGAGTDSTGRINLYSYQRANVGSYGENIRNFAMRADAKTMQAFYIPVQSATKKGGYDPATRDPLASGIGWKPVVWQGAHYEANDHSSIHGHWELEIADLSGALQGRLEIPFIDQPTDGTKALDQATIGVAYTNIRTNLADLSVRAQNMTAGPYSGQNTGFRVGGNNTVNKDVMLSISSDMGTTGRRWILRANTTTESGSNAGTDFQIRRYDDTGTFLDAPLHIERSTGRIGIGNATTPLAQLHVQRATGQVLYLDAQAASQSALLINGVDTTVKAVQAQVATDTQKRFQILVDGSQSWGPGGTTAPDTTFYRAAAGRLKTDGALHAVTSVLVNTTSVGGGVGVVGIANATTLPTGTPSGGGVLYVEAGSLKYKGSSGTVSVIAPA